MALRFLTKFRKADGHDTAKENEALVKRLQIRRRRIDLGLRYLPILSWLLLAASHAYLLALPYSGLSRGTYVSENALQPAQVNTYWSWPEVHQADKLAKDVEDWSVLDAKRRSGNIQAYFQSIGLSSARQCYNLSSRADRFRGIENDGCNAHAIIKAPKTDGAEAIVLAASWLSRDSARVNTRGVAVVLALAKHLSKYSLWSKDIVILIADGYLAGTQTWLSSYHGIFEPAFESEPNLCQTGPIWAAMHIDYPYHSFSHLGLYFEGTNGLLPNLDLVNSVAHIAKWTGGSPVILHDTFDEYRHNKYQQLGPLSKVLDSSAVKDFELSSRNILQQIKRQTFGSPSGPEGVYTPFRIDAIALYAVPAEGPHGFYSIARTIESSMRSINNLLERMHASAFLYLMTGPYRFIGLANYLAVPLLAGIALSLKGLAIWATLFPSTKADMAKRPVRLALLVIFATHIFGFMSLHLVGALPLAFGATAAFVSTSTIIIAYGVSQAMPSNLRQTLAAFSLLATGMVICVVAILNFSLSTYLALLMSVPLLLFLLSTSGASNVAPTLIGASIFISTGAAYAPHVQQLVFEWQALGSWFIPFTALAILPLQMQALIISQCKKEYPT